MEKEDLLRYRDLSREVSYLQLRLRELEQTIYAPKGQRFTAIPHATSGKGKTMDDVVCKHIEIENLYLEKLAEKNAQLLEVEMAIESLSDPAERMVLRYRYIDGYSWSCICDEMGYGERQVFRLHGHALLNLKGK